MHYFALILFGLGVAFVVIGLCINNKSKSNNNLSPPGPEPNPSPKPLFGVDIKSGNPLLIEKSSYLYLDSSGKNIYTQDQKFSLEDLQGIRRFGEGKFGYDGFKFIFSHKNGQELFLIENLNQISFYPNCIVLIQKNHLPVAILFFNKTEKVRSIIQVFSIDHGN